MTSTAAPAAAGSRLAAAEAAVGVLCTDTDPAVLSGADALDALGRVTVITRKLAALQTVLALRVIDANQWQGRGSPTAPMWLARQLGCTTGAAHQMLATAKKLDDRPATRQAFANGEISSDEAAAITAAAAVDPSAEAALLAGATGGHDLAATRAASGQVRRQSRSRADEQARTERLHRSRRWT